MSGKGSRGPGTFPGKVFVCNLAVDDMAERVRSRAKKSGKGKMW